MHTVNLMKEEEEEEEEEEVVSGKLSQYPTHHAMISNTVRFFISADLNKSRIL